MARSKRKYSMIYKKKKTKTKQATPKKHKQTSKKHLHQKRNAKNVKILEPLHQSLNKSQLLSGKS